MTQTAQSLEHLLVSHVARFTDRKADWDAFADARVEGFRRAQHRFIGSGASGKADAAVIPAEHFTLSIMFVPPTGFDAIVGGVKWKEVRELVLSASPKEPDPAP